MLIEYLSIGISLLSLVLAALAFLRTRGLDQSKWKVEIGKDFANLAPRVLDYEHRVGMLRYDYGTADLDHLDPKCRAEVGVIKMRIDSLNRQAFIYSGAIRQLRENLIHARSVGNAEYEDYKRLIHDCEAEMSTGEELLQEFERDLQRYQSRTVLTTPRKTG